MPLEPLVQQPLRNEFDLAGVADTVQRIQTARAIGEERARRAQEAARSQQEDDQIRQLIQQSGGDLDSAVEKAYSINPEKAGKMQQTIGLGRKAQVDLLNAQLTQREKVAELGAQALELYDPNDPSSWGHSQAALSSIYHFAGMETPQEFQGPPPDAETVKRWQMSAMSTKDKLANEREDRMAEFQKGVTTRAEAAQARADQTAALAQKREDRMANTQEQQLAVSRGQLGVAQGNLGIRQQELNLQIQKRADELKNGSVGVKLPAATAQVVAGLDQSVSLIDELKGLKNDEWLGPVAGRLTSAKIAAPGFKIDDDLAKFAAQTATLKNSVIKAITGAQMSEPEAKRIMQQVPDFTDKPEVWIQKAEETRKNAVAMRKRIVALSGGSEPDEDTSSKPTGGKRFQIISVK